MRPAPTNKAYELAGSMHALPHAVPPMPHPRASCAPIAFSQCLRSIDDKVRKDVSAPLAARARSQRCDCASLMDCMPELRNESGHVICRSEKQWAVLLGTALPLVFTHHARQAVIPSPDDRAQGVERMCERLKSLTFCEKACYCGHMIEGLLLGPSFSVEG